MIRIFKQIYFTVLVILSLLSCKNDNKNTYAIRDFKKSLQPYLTEAVSKGIVGYDTSYRFIKTHATDKELNKLSSSEHPVLRATAFRAMLARPGFNDFELLMSHLDDTAIVATDEGEFGVDFSSISDDIIQNSTWKNIDEKNKTINEVIIKHKYLRSAYMILPQIDAQEKYYDHIREMAQRDSRFDDIEYALYALAKFKKTEDIQIIKNLLLSHHWEMSRVSFRIMRDFPDSAYFEVLEKYYKKDMYASICENLMTSEARSFFKAIAVYKNNWSAEILSTILNREPFMPCEVNANHLKQELIFAIWNNECKPYSKMRRQIEAFVIDYKKRTTGLPIENPYTGPEIIRWWRYFPE